MRRPWWRWGASALLLAGVAAVLILPSRGGSGASSVHGTYKTQAALTAERDLQELAALISTQTVFRSPDGSSVGEISSARPITGERTVLPVLGVVFRGGAEWLHVRLPGRPNGHTGWIKQAGTRLEYTPWRLVVNTEKRRVYAYDAGRLVRTFHGVFAAPATPTPKGDFFVEETVALAPSAVGYPYALALSARSNVFQEFDGGPGQIALHGLGNVGGTIGTAVSHGCIRLTTPDITWLARHIDPGVPVKIF
jgi:lipoprotein-anchoring transpeptidase ErfK/SrfK